MTKEDNAITRFRKRFGLVEGDVESPVQPSELESFFLEELKRAREVMEAERAEIIHEWNKAEQRLDGTAQGAVNAIEQFRNYLTK